MGPLSPMAIIRLAGTVKLQSPVNKCVLLLLLEVTDFFAPKPKSSVHYTLLCIWLPKAFPTLLFYHEINIIQTKKKNRMSSLVTKDGKV